MIQDDIHKAANELLQFYVDGERKAWAKLRDSLPREIKPFVMDLEQRQRLMFEFDDYRYLPWCTVRPKNGKRTENPQCS